MASPELDGEDLRDLPLARCKGELKILLKRAPFGLALNDYAAGDGPALFALRHGPGGHRVKAAEFALPVGPLAALAQGEESGEPGGAARGARGLGPEALSESAVLRQRTCASECVHFR